MASTPDGGGYWLASSDQLGLEGRVEPEDLGALKRQPLELVFVLDCSGSMSGRPIEQAKDYTARALYNYTERDPKAALTGDWELADLDAISGDHPELNVAVHAHHFLMGQPELEGIEKDGHSPLVAVGQDEVHDIPGNKRGDRDSADAVRA